LLAFLFAVKQFRCYLYGRKFVVHTDHRALKWLLNLQDPSSRLTRWAIKLSEYDYVVEHRPGTKMRHADALSRSVHAVQQETVLSKEVIRREQEADELCNRYRGYENFWTDNDGVLYRQGPKEQPRIVIPGALVKKVLSSYHELPFTAHQGVSRTIGFISKKYWWETLREDVSVFIKECEACAKRKTGRKTVAPLGETQVAYEFLDVVSLDIVGPLPVTEKGNRYLLTFIDHFTRFCEAIPIARQDTETVAREFVLRIITQFGVPKKLLTDRGANFTSALIKETCKLLKIQKLQTSSYHPQADGVCERMHKLLIDMISHFVRKDTRNWDDYVPYAIMAYRAMPHCSTKYSPYYLVFGKDMRLPIEDDWTPQLGDNNLQEVDYENHVKVLAKRLQEASRVAKQQSKLSHEVAKRYYDRYVKREQFNKGDFVYLHDPTCKRSKARKFSYQYKGPFEVEQRIFPLIYKLRMADGTSAVVHVNRLKRAYGNAVQRCVGPLNDNSREQVKLKETKRNAPRGKSEKGNRTIDSHSLKESSGSDESDIERNSSLQENTEDPEWTPGSYYTRKQLQGSDATDDNVAYRLRSRLVNRSEQAAARKHKPGEQGHSLGQEQMSGSAHDNTPPGRNKFMKSHPYNLRSNVEFTYENSNE